MILVANAHMHWDPEYSDVKLIQTMMFLSELKSIAERASGSMATGSPTSDPASVPIVLCADLNSLPDSGRTEPPLTFEPPTLVGWFPCCVKTVCSSLINTA